MPHFFSGAKTDNLLSVNLNVRDSPGNRPSMVYTSDASTLVNRAAGMPASGSFIARREVLWFDKTHVMVVLTEAFPSAGRVWFDFYNNDGWKGWRSVAAS